MLKTLILFSIFSSLNIHATTNSGEMRLEDAIKLGTCNIKVKETIIFKPNVRAVKVGSYIIHKKIDFDQYATREILKGSNIQFSSFQPAGVGAIVVDDNIISNIDSNEYFVSKTFVNSFANNTNNSLEIECQDSTLNEN